ncbi:site-specific tyrosine recombinase/integron integrase [Sulfuracidifex metallicus]|uniref:Tyrosine recombinase XerA n=1 Tax=Sulfuracidifex metallicus DSM 6482 = JCM 9184 TaxID=523847 RepID=A0A6A9QH90_SULME|nr:site-specific tyrosine recombinase/integron integrase [Sulfuracidifex metallicus]MUN28064.1 tyrosine-type recombinase/integrase [Sulfuracidifex metallicus DSM 6482 = JCM 9184]WOE51390.1 tyrosine-type recombinase/integrase [Sulfuracidifex metallicus DSM 6482 = JCM 9184]
MKLEIGNSSEDHSVESFINALIVAGAGNGTVKLYSSAVKDFLNFVDKDPREITQADFNNWLIDLMKREGKAKGDEIERKRARSVTLRYYAIAVRRYLKWIGRELKVPLPRIRRREFSSLSEGQLNDLILHARGKKTKLILRLLAETGMRANELLSIRPSDINLEERRIRLRNTKNGEERIVFFTEETGRLLRAYIKGIDNDTRIFDMSYQALYKMIRRAGKRCGIENLRPHIMRHTFATLAIKRGVPLPVVQRLLGHHDIKTTQIYTHLISDDIKEMYRRAFG